MRLSAGHTTLRPVHPGGGEGREANNDGWLHDTVQYRSERERLHQWRQSLKRPSQHHKTIWVLKLSPHLKKGTTNILTKIRSLTHIASRFSTSPAFRRPQGALLLHLPLAPHGPAAAPVRPSPLLTPMPLAHRCCAACSKSSPLMKPDCTSSAQKPILALRKSAWPARACGRAYTVRPCSRLWRRQRGRYRPPP